MLGMKHRYSDVDSDQPRKKSRMNATGSGGMRNGGSTNYLDTVSWSEMLHNQDIDDRASCPLQVGPGVGPNPFAEQQPRVVVCLAEESMDFRATHADDAVFGNWVPGVDPNRAYSIQKSEILCRVIRGDEQVPRWMESHHGNHKRMYPKVFTSFTNFKKGTKWGVVGAVRNPGAGRGQVDNINDKSVSGLVGGTITLPHSGRFRIYNNDHLYYLEQSYTKPVKQSDPTGYDGFITMCPMKGMDATKRLGELIPLGQGTIDDFITEQLDAINEALKYNLFNDYSRDQRAPSSRGPPSILKIKNFLKEHTTRLERGVQGRITDLIKIIQIHALQEIISKCESHALMSSNQAESNNLSYQDVTAWKLLAGEVMMILAGLLIQHYTEQARCLPAYMIKDAWQQKLPVVIDPVYRANKAYEYMPISTGVYESQLEHVKSGSKMVFLELTRNIKEDLSEKFVGTALSGAEPNCPVDVDLKRM